MLSRAGKYARVLRVYPYSTPPIDCRNGFCTAEAGRCLLRTRPRKPQLPCAAGPWAGKTVFEMPILPDFGVTSVNYDFADLLQRARALRA